MQSVAGQTLQAIPLGAEEKLLEAPNSGEGA